MIYILSRIKRWPFGFKLLYLLMVFDGLATYLGLQMGVIIEGNPLLAAGFNSYPLLTLLLKLCFSLLFLEVICYAIMDKKLKWPTYSIPALLLIHLFVAFLHLHWIGLWLA